MWLTHSDLQQEPEHRYQSISSEMFVNSWSSPVGNQFDWDSSNTWQCWNSGCGWEVALRLLLWSLGLLVAKICESFKNFTQFGDICASKSSIRQNSCRGNVHAASLVGAPACNVAAGGSMCSSGCSYQKKKIGFMRREVLTWHESVRKRERWEKSNPHSLLFLSQAPLSVTLRRTRLASGICDQKLPFFGQRHIWNHFKM